MIFIKPLLNSIKQVRLGVINVLTCIVHLQEGRHSGEFT